jgi:hypothetical protein
MENGIVNRLPHLEELNGRASLTPQVLADESKDGGEHKKRTKGSTENGSYAANTPLADTTLSQISRNLPVTVAKNGKV